MSGRRKALTSTPWITLFAIPSEKVTENELKEKIRGKCEEITLEEVRKSIWSFKKRLRAVCEQNGGHIDHLLN